MLIMLLILHTVRLTVVNELILAQISSVYSQFKEYGPCNPGSSPGTPLGTHKRYDGRELLLDQSLYP